MAGAEWLLTGSRGGNQRPSVAAATFSAFAAAAQAPNLAAAAPDCGSGIFQAPLAILRKTGSLSSRRRDLLHL